MTKTVGNISAFRGILEFEWEIQKFAEILRSEKMIDCMRSSTFTFFHMDLQLVLKICQNDSQCLSQWIGLYLENLEGYTKLPIEYTFGIRTSDGKGIKLWRAFPTFRRYFHGRSKFLLKSDVLSDNSRKLSSGSLIITCSLEQRHPDYVSRLEDLYFNMLNLMSSVSNSDVTFSVKDVKFPAHRNILGARSPVFASMFKHEMSEKATGIVEIDDCEPSIFQTFLHYIYSGRVDYLKCINLVALYEVADKYFVNELKEDCVNSMIVNMSVDGFCNVFTLALRYDEKSLLRRAFKFFKEHKKGIVETSKRRLLYRITLVKLKN